MQNDTKPLREWTLDDFARHYAETLASSPNGLGAHVSPVFGYSHTILRDAYKRFGVGATDNAFAAAIKDAGL